MRLPGSAQTWPALTWCAPSRNTIRSYELIWEERRYPHKAILGTAYEFATGRRLGSADFEGGKSGAVEVLRELGFTVQDKQ